MAQCDAIENGYSTRPERGSPGSKEPRWDGLGQARLPWVVAQALVVMSLTWRQVQGLGCRL